MNEIKSVSLIIPDKYGISTENSNVIAKNCIPIIQEFNNLEIEFDLIMGEKEMTADIAKSSKALRNKYVKVRTGGVKVIQASKEDAKKQVDAHDQLNRDFKDEITSREDQLREKELHFEKIEAEKLAKIRQARTIELDKYETFYGAGDIALLDDVLYGHFLNGVKADFEAKKEAEKKAEAERIAKQKAAEAEQKRIKAENERLKKEAEAKRIDDEKAEKERKRLAKIEQDKRYKEEQAHELELKKEREEKARIQKELEASEILARSIVEVERKRKEAEAKAARKSELDPDKIKLNRWVDNMNIAIETKNLTQESEYIVFDIYKKHDLFKQWAKGEIEKVK